MFGRKGNTAASFGEWPAFLSFGSSYGPKTTAVSPTFNQGSIELPKRAPQDEQPRDNTQVPISRPSDVQDKDSLPRAAIPMRRPLLYAWAESESTCAILSSSEESSEDSSSDSSDDSSDDEDCFSISERSAMTRSRRTSSTYTGYSTPYEEEDSFSDDESLAKVRARRSSSTPRQQPPAQSFTSQPKQHCRSDSASHTQSGQRRYSFIELQQEQQQQPATNPTPEDAEQARRRQAERKEKLARHESEDRKFYEASVAEYKSDDGDDTARATQHKSNNTTRITEPKSNKPDPAQEELNWHREVFMDPQGMLRDPVVLSDEKKRREKRHKLAVCTWMKTKMKSGSVNVEGAGVGVPKLVLTDPAGVDWSLKDARRYEYETWGRWNKRVGRCRAHDCYCRPRTYYGF